LHPKYSRIFFHILHSALGVKRYALSIKRSGSALSFLIFGILNLQQANAQCCLPDNLPLKKMVESDVLKSAHVGVYVFDDSSKKIIADYQSDKYFVPASNTKLFSLYAGMKYLGDSLPGVRYIENDTALFLFPTGDPSFLHPDFQSQPVFDLMKKTRKKIYLVDMGWNETALGKGWAWDDYNDDYSVERSQFPVYGNFIRWTEQKSEYQGSMGLGASVTAFSSPEISWKTNIESDSLPTTDFVKRALDSNVFTLHLQLKKEISEPTQDVPFVTNNLQAVFELLPDTLGKKIYLINLPKGLSLYPQKTKTAIQNLLSSPGEILYSRPADSVFIPMMYRSDNFFAEQTLLMLSNKKLGFMKDETIIDSLLSGPLADLPQKPSWVDGSGLSRYNLFTPQDFVSLLIKFKNEFGMDRMKTILPSGGSGTLKNYYKSDSGYIFMKTGSMTGVLCISGFLYTHKKHLLEFSVLVNNHNGGSSAIRRQVEAFIENLRRNN
jgi:D-alanyl-D-alanine carboxypeptidase/D-alanyl-D-alanine-endopeptidase (penicillin-binding protein 4)